MHLKMDWAALWLFARVFGIVEEVEIFGCWLRRDLWPLEAVRRSLEAMFVIGEEALSLWRG